MLDTYNKNRSFVKYFHLEFAFPKACSMFVEVQEICRVIPIRTRNDNKQSFFFSLPYQRTGKVIRHESVITDSDAMPSYQIPLTPAFFHSSD